MTPNWTVRVTIFGYPVLSGEVDWSEGQAEGFYEETGVSGSAMPIGADDEALAPDDDETGCVYLLGDGTLFGEQFASDRDHEERAGFLRSVVHQSAMLLDRYQAEGFSLRVVTTYTRRMRRPREGLLPPAERILIVRPGQEDQAFREVHDEMKQNGERATHFMLVPPTPPR